VPRTGARPSACAKPANGANGGAANDASGAPGANSTTPARKGAKQEARALAAAAAPGAAPAPLPPLPDQRGARLRAADSRIPWAELLKRTYDVDSLACSRCGGRLTFIAVITDRGVARDILESLGERVAHPVVARARGPTEWDGVDPPTAWDA
jgi:hypothetical protein